MAPKTAVGEGDADAKKDSQAEKRLAPHDAGRKEKRAKGASKWNGRKGGGKGRDRSHPLAGVGPTADGMRTWTGTHGGSYAAVDLAAEEAALAAEPAAEVIRSPCLFL